MQRQELEKHQGHMRRTKLPGFRVRLDGQKLGQLSLGTEVLAGATVPLLSTPLSWPSRWVLNMLSINLAITVHLILVIPRGLSPSNLHA